MEYTYRLADKNIRIISLYKKVHDYCRDYRVNAVPDFTVTISQSDIDFERRRSDSISPPSPDSYLEELAVYRKIAEKMPDYNTFLFHGSAVAVDGQAYLFTAKSGTGKSTHTRLWREYLGNRAVMVNDDKPLIKVDNGTVTIYGTPYNGKHHLGCNIAVPLKAVCVLQRAADNTISPVSKADVYPILLQQSYRSANPLQIAKTLRLIDEMTDNISLYRLGCNMEIDAARIAYLTMKG